MKNRMWVVLALTGLMLSASSLAALPFGKSWARGAELPRPWGVGIDVFAMDQGYDVQSLSFTAQGIPFPSVTGLEVQNSVTEINVKLDAWLLPFLNAFVIVGDLNGETDVDLRNVNVPLPFDQFHFEYDGLVYGGGMTLAAGGRRIFGSLTASYTETNLGGDFDSSVKSFVLFPKIGIQGQKGAYWLGAMYLNTDEHHSGSIPVPLLGTVAFDILLGESDALSYLVGTSVTLDHVTLALEGGFSNRTTMLISLGYRF